MNMNINKPRLFIDMDGTLTEWRILQKNEELEIPGYFYSLKPHINVLNAIKRIIADNEIDVYILSCIIENNSKVSPKKEKELWLKKYLPELKKEKYIFVPNGENKVNYVPDGILKNDFLLDDYTHNLMLWALHGNGIKLLNNINSSKGTWKGSQINFNNNANEIYNAIKRIILDNQLIRNNNPLKMHTSFDKNTIDFSHYIEEIETSLHQEEADLK